MSALYRKAVLAAAVTAALGFAYSPAWAVHDLGLVELDGDTDVDGAVAGLDWDDLNNGTTPTLGGATGGGAAAGGCDIAEFITHTFAPDPAGETIFKGGDKDIHDTKPDQGWKSGSVPDKNELTNAYAAAFDCDGDLIVYFGSDRFSVEGNAFTSFWFYKNNVQPLPDGTFSDTHEVGDTLVLVNHEKGGGVPDIGIFKWVGVGGDISGTLQTIVAPGAAGCNGAHPAGSGEACGVTNEFAAINFAWDYTPKGGALGDAGPPGSFFEGGINFDALFPGDEQCFGSFRAETRASSSVTAQLKDFTGDVFEVCGVELTMNCTLDAGPDGIAGTNDDGFNSDFTGYAYDLQGTTRSTRGTLDHVQIFLDLDNDGAPGTNILMDTESPVTTANSSWGTYDREDSVNPVTYYAFAVGWIGDIGTGTKVTSTTNASATCPGVTPNTGISATKVCRTCLEINSGKVTVFIKAAGQVCNEGDLPLINVTATDNKAGAITLASTTLAPKGDTGDCTSYSLSYNPGLGSIASGVPDIASFMDTVTVSGTVKLLGGTVNNGAGVTATCKLCPDPNDGIPDGDASGLTCPTPALPL